MTRKDITLREFKYFDRQIVTDFLSEIEGGLAKESKASYVEKSGQLGATVGLPLAKVEGEKGTKEISIEESKTIEDAALFQRLYETLATQKMIYKIDWSKDDSWHNVTQGKILEIYGRLELPFFEVALEMFNQLLPIMQQMSPQGIDQKAIVASKMLNQLSSLSALNVRIIPTQRSNVNLVATLQRQKLKVPKQESECECYTLCRVRTVLKERETFDMFKLPMRMNEETKRKLLESFDNMPLEALVLLGKKPTTDDLQIRYPAVIFNPIAIYQ